jgi:hypothetical protein
MAKVVFLFFQKKIMCGEPLAKAVGKGVFYFFKKILCRGLGKAGTPELGKFFPELPSVFARSPRQRRHILFFCFPH